MKRPTYHALTTLTVLFAIGFGLLTLDGLWSALARNDLAVFRAGGPRGLPPQLGLRQVDSLELPPVARPRTAAVSPGDVRRTRMDIFRVTTETKIGEFVDWYPAANAAEAEAKARADAKEYGLPDDATFQVRRATDDEVRRIG